MKASAVAVLSLLVSVSWACSEPLGLEVSKDAEKSYEKRRAKELSESELQLVGKFSGANRELKWEIHRHSDGTFELVLHQKVDGLMREDYTKGIWGIEGNRYYVVDLESLNRFPGGEPDRFWEKIHKISKDRFETVSEGHDGEELVSPEIRVAEFEFSLWSEIGDSTPK